LGIKPLFVLENPNNPTALLNDFIRKAYGKNYFVKSKNYVITMGSSTGKSGSTNLIRVLSYDSILDVIKKKSPDSHC